ncbi:hypothetical protein Tco_0408207 [Tanacetum coccineum]
MTTLAKNVIVVGADNSPPMLKKSMYNSWQSRMRLYIRGKEHGKDLIDSVDNGPFQYGTVVVDDITRARTYKELTDKEKINEECDIRATNIVLKGLPPDVYNIVNHHTLAKEIWDRYNPSQYQQQLSPIAHQLYTPHQQPLSYEALAHQQVYQSPASHQTSMILQQAYHSPAVQQQPQAVFPQQESGFTVPSFLPGDDPIASLNKAMAFTSTTITSNYPLTNNQIRTSSKPRNQAIIQDGRVTVQQVQGRQSQSFTGSGSLSNANNIRGNRNVGTNAANQTRVIRCYNYHGEEQLAFLEDPGVAQGPETQTTLPINAAFQTDDLDAFDLDCDEAPYARVMLIANLSSYDSDVLSDVPISDTI